MVTVNMVRWEKVLLKDLKDLLDCCISVRVQNGGGFVQQKDTLGVRQHVLSKSAVAYPTRSWARPGHKGRLVGTESRTEQTKRQDIPEFLIGALTKGSKLERKVPENITGSCGIISMRLRGVFRESLEKSILLVHEDAVIGNLGPAVQCHNQGALASNYSSHDTNLFTVTNLETDGLKGGWCVR